MSQTNSTIMSDRTILLRYLLGWVGMVFVAIFNGILRGVMFTPVVSDLAAHQISCITGVLLFFIVAMIYDRKWPINTGRQAVLIGFMWVVLTPIFEFNFGTFVMGQPLEYLINDYNLLAGRAWSLVLLAIFLIPTAVYRIRRRSE